MEDNKIKETAEIIEKISDILSRGGKSGELSALKEHLESLTGRENIDVEQFRDFWTFTNPESLAERLLMPEAEKIKLSDSDIHRIVKKICLADYSEAETDYWIEVLEKVTGLPVSDYIYFPYLMGLEPEADEAEIAEKIIEDRVC